jgi:hypothetical protein
MTQQRMDSFRAQHSVSLPVVADLLAAYRRTHRPITREMAIADLLVAVDRGTLMTYRYYAVRWRWSVRKARELFRELGLLGSPLIEQHIATSTDEEVL